ncbi:protein tyrosine kinase domain-containing protein [Ditylenchus destructor]|nr:protein tyrosine kinase domain-containing protein [Ditylenchus destructor]
MHSLIDSKNFSVGSTFNGHFQWIGSKDQGNGPVCKTALCHKTIDDLQLSDLVVTKESADIMNRFLEALNTTEDLCIDKMHVFSLTNINCRNSQEYEDFHNLLQYQETVGEFFKDVGIKVQGNFISSDAERRQECSMANLMLSSEGSVEMRFLGSTSQLNDPEKVNKLDSPTGINWLLAVLVSFGIIGLSSCVGLFVFIRRRQRRSLVDSLFKGPARRTDSEYWQRYVDNGARRLGKKRNESDEWELLPESLNLFRNEQLGSGAFAFVYKGQLIGRNPLLENRNTNYVFGERENMCNDVAVKVLRNSIDERNRIDMWREIEFMKELGYHPHILNLIGFVFDEDSPLLVLEYCALGDLLTLIRNNKQSLFEDCGIAEHAKESDDSVVDDEEKSVDDEEEKNSDRGEKSKTQSITSPKNKCNLTLNKLISFSWQVSDAMVYLSSRNHIHRDIAARNVLITGNMVAKLGDFGLCRHSVEQLYTTQGGKLPIKWMAIEALKMAEFSSKTDVWSFGVMLFEIFSAGDTPYPTIQAADMLQHLLEGNRLKQPILSPDEIYKLMRECWLEDPERRPTCEQVRKRITTALEMSTDSYGYVDFRSPEYLKYSELNHRMQVQDSNVNEEDENSAARNHQIDHEKHQATLNETTSIQELQNQTKKEIVDSQVIGINQQLDFEEEQFWI